MKNICCGAIGVLCLLGGEGGAGGEVAGVGEVGFGGEEGGGAAAGFGAVGVGPAGAGYVCGHPGVEDVAYFVFYFGFFVWHVQQGHKEEGYVAVYVGKCGSVAVVVDVGYGVGECGELFFGWR